MANYIDAREILVRQLSIGFILLAFLRVTFSSFVTGIRVKFFTEIYISVAMLLVNIISTIGTAFLGYWVIFAIIHQATSSYYMLAIIEIVFLLSVALSPGYFMERRLLLKHIPDKPKCIKLAFVSALYMLILSLLLTYAIYSVEMGKFDRL